MKQIEIKKVSLSDMEQLQEIGRQTFSETFAEINTEENMCKYLEECFNSSQLTAELTNKDSEFYFATIENKVTGYLKINFGLAQTELKESNGMELERIYVLKKFLGKKVGQILYDKALQMAVQKKMDYIWLGVWEENYRAQNFYKRNGFVAFDKHIFRLGDDEQTDIMMRLNLKK